MNLYRNESSNPKWNAQRNLQGRSHFVDDDTLRSFKSRVISTYITDGGMLLAIVTSDALDYENTKRGFRYTIFDVFGTTVERHTEESYRTSTQAIKAMWAKLNTLDARTITLAAIESATRHHARNMERLRDEVDKIETNKAA